MKTTNTNLINILLWAWIKPNMLVDSFSIIAKLIKKHGKMLFTEKYIQEISQVASNLWNLISILKAVHKIDYKDMKSLILMTKRLADNYSPEFQISSDSNDHNQKLKDYINTKFQESNINTNVLDKIWVSVSWEWRYYKRDLDSDLEKILGS